MIARPSVKKGDRVILDYPENLGLHNKHGVIAHTPVYKTRPHKGKTPGWWVRVNIDHTESIKVFWVEIHANHVRKEHG